MGTCKEGGVSGLVCSHGKIKKGKLMNLLYLDFETYYDVQLSLTKMTTVQYVNHPDFKIWGVGLKFNEGDTEWFGEDQYQDALEQIPWEETAVVCHNTLFDAYILTQYLGFYLKDY